MNDGTASGSAFVWKHGFKLLVMVDLFMGRVLVKNNWDQDELNTEREITGTLENRVLMLFFAREACETCREFVPVLNDFFKRLKDPFYIENPALLALVYVSLDETEEQQEKFLKELHKRSLFVAFEDSYRKELQARFQVTRVPAVVVLRPDGSVLSADGVDDIRRLGASCFRSWQESAALVERSFAPNEEYDELNLRSATDPVRRLRLPQTSDRVQNSLWNTAQIPLLLYISLDQSGEQQQSLLKELPKKRLFLAYEDPYRNEPEAVFEVEEKPRVVVLRRDCMCAPQGRRFAAWARSATAAGRRPPELIDRRLLMDEDFDEKSMRRLQ